MKIKLYKFHSNLNFPEEGIGMGYGDKVIVLNDVVHLRNWEADHDFLAVKSLSQEFINANPDIFIEI